MSHVIYYGNNQSIHLTDGVTVRSLSAGLIQKICAATYHLCQNAFHQKPQHKFKKWCKFSGHIPVKSRNEFTCKTRSAHVTIGLLVLMTVMVPNMGGRKKKKTEVPPLPPHPFVFEFKQRT